MVLSPRTHRNEDAPEGADGAHTRRTFLHIWGTAVAHLVQALFSSPSMSVESSPMDPLVPEHREVTVESVQEHINRLVRNGAIRIVRLDALSTEQDAGCPDGRRTTPVAGMFGGTTGEVVKDFHALEAASGQHIPDKRIPQAVRAWIAANGGIHLHTDMHAIENAAHKLGMKKEELRILLENISTKQIKVGKQHDRLIEALSDQECLGCGHCNCLCHELKGKEYGVRPAIAKSVIRTVIGQYLQGDPRVRYEILEGIHNEKGILVVEGQGDLIPLIPPHAEGRSFFVIHPRAQTALNAKFAMQAQDITGIAVDRTKLLSEMKRLSDQYQRLTMKYLGVDTMPTFRVRMEGAGKLAVERIP